ncbi:Hsp70 family protein [Dactylosporangium sp. CA-233914]|uniref:Hsp70 family protein n=1 Tax=Dactylosporangium sp. CA-233914 TaxID=3239934 RepID=UPI003D8DC085
MTTTRLGIDFGTSHTVAVLARPGGRADALLFEASPLLPSAVYLGGDGLLVGRDAERSARIEPGAYEPHPKRRIDDGKVLLDGREVPVPVLVEAILRRVAEEAYRTLGGPPGSTVLTHPAGWGATRRSLLTAAAEAAGLPGVTLVAEPVAAAMYFTGVLGHRVPDGHAVVVYDFGGGTFDVSVVRRAGAGWHVVAAAGLDDVGGIDLDAAIVERVRTAVAGRAPEVWQRLERPATVTDRRHRRALWEDARSTKELLSRATSAGLAVPLLDVDLYLTRPEFEALARPWLDRTIALTTATLSAGDGTVGRLSGVFLVGGGSRVPLVATLLHQALGIAPVILEQPELVVAHGSLLTPAPAAPPAAVPAPPPAVPAPPPAVPDPPPAAPPPAALPPLPPPAPRAPRRRPVLWPPAALAVIAGLGVTSLLLRDGYDRVAPPLLAGLLTPLLPASVAVLLAMVTGLVVGGSPGDPPAPAYRALGPAVVAAGGGVLGLFALALTHDFDRALSLSGRWYSGDAHAFSEAAPWIVAAASIAMLLIGVYRIARPVSPDPLARPWRWAGAGALLVLAGAGPVRLPFPAFDGDTVTDVQPLSGVMSTGGELSWWGAYLLGLTVMLAAALSLAAALRPAIVRDAEVHRAAGRVGAVLLVGSALALLLNAAWERTPGPLVSMIHRWYWSTFVRLDERSGLAWFWLVLAVAPTLAIAVPSLVRHAGRLTRRG